MSEKLRKRIEEILPKGFTYCVEESKGLPIGVYAAKDAKNKLLYIQLASKEEALLGLAFTILTRQDCEKLGISVEESYSGSLSDYYVEESSKEDELWNPEKEDLEAYKARMKAKMNEGSLSEEQLNKLLEKTNQVIVNLPKGTKVSGTEEDARAKQFFKDARQKLCDKLAEVGHEIKLEQIQNMDDLTVFSGLYNDLKKGSQKSGEKRGGSGTAPLSAESGESGEPLEFESYEEMLRYLERAQALEVVNPAKAKEAKKILDTILHKGLKGQKQLKRGFEFEWKPTDEEGNPIGYKEAMNREAQKRALEGKKAREESE